MPDGLPPGLTETELAKYAARQNDIASANAKPLPGPLLEAFDPLAPSVCGFTLVPVVGSHLPMLQRIGSPLMRIVDTLAKHPPTNGDTNLGALIAQAVAMPNPGETENETSARVWEETIETFFVFTKPAAEARAILRKGREVFRETALAEIGDKVNPSMMPQIQEAIARHFAAAFATQVHYEEEKTEDGSSFTNPPVNQRTVLAGG
jgi:hypothetical protein